MAIFDHFIKKRELWFVVLTLILSVVFFYLGNQPRSHDDLTSGAIEHILQELSGVDSLVRAQNYKADIKGNESFIEAESRWFSLKITSEPKKPTYLSLMKGSLWEFNIYQPPLYEAQKYSSILSRVDDVSDVLNFAVPVAQNALSGEPIFIEVTKGVMPKVYSFYNEVDLLEHNEVYRALFISMITLLIFAVLFSLFLWVKLNNSAYALYSAFFYTSFLAYIFYTGFWVNLISGDLLTYNAWVVVTNVLATLSYLVGAKFSMNYMQSSVYVPEISRFVNKTLFVLFLVTCIFVVSGGNALYITVSRLIWILIAITVGIITFLSWRAGSRYAIYIMIGWTPILMAAINWSFVEVGFKPGKDTDLFLFISAVIFEVVIFQFALSDMALSYREERDRAINLACRDALTGAYNRHGLKEMSVDIYDELNINGVDVTLSMLDLDNFKTINDTYGHDFGDECLRRTADTIQQQLREEDKLIRFGGEEFLIILKGSDLLKAKEVCERIRLSLHDIEVPYENEIIRLTASIGVAPLAKHQLLSKSIKLADEAMYSSKHNGRDRVTVWRAKTLT